MNMEGQKTSALYEQHVQLTGGKHMATFAGYVMPLWYSSISAEHQAVREKAGLFDCTHMGVLEFSGIGAEAFLDYVTTNRVAALKIGRAQYSYVLNEKGGVIDDVIVYRREEQRFMMVVNASNDTAVQGHLKNVLSDWSGADVRMRDLRDPAAGSDQRVDIALQGPAAMEVLEAWGGKGDLVEQVSDLRPFGFVEAAVGGVELMICRTGYTGAAVGCELLVHPDQVGMVWEGLLKAGEPLGLLPCGLGSRDSLRIEAGLPLYGHELAGEYDISPFEAGYGWAVKLDKTDFIGIDVMKARAASYDMQVVRVGFTGGKGVRPLRGGDAILGIDKERVGHSPTLQIRRPHTKTQRHKEDIIYLEDGGHGPPYMSYRVGNELPTLPCVGWLLSCTTVEDRQIGLAYVKRDLFSVGDPISGYYLARSQRHIEQGKKEKVNKGELVEVEITGKVLERFEKF